MRTKACLLLMLGWLFFVFSNADAQISWSGDSFHYSAVDQGGIYYDLNAGPPVLLDALGDKSSSNGDVENTAVATATESQPGLNMASAAWGNSFGDAAQDSGGATVYAYAQNNDALIKSIGVCLNGQNVSSFIDRGFTVSSTGVYTISASALEPLAWNGLTSGTATAPQPTLTGEVQIFQTDPHQVTTLLLDSDTFSLASLVASPQQATFTLVAGDSYQLVVGLSSITSVGGQGGQPGISTAFNNLDSSKNPVVWLGQINGVFNVGAEQTPVTITASLSPASSSWQNATDVGDWKWFDWFGYFNANYFPWIYSMTLGWLYTFGTSTDNIWWWDAKSAGFWWTTQSLYPYIYMASKATWVYYYQGSSNPRLFYNFNTGQWESD